MVPFEEKLALSVRELVAKNFVENKVKMPRRETENFAISVSNPDKESIKTETLKNYLDDELKDRTDPRMSVR